MAKKFQTKAYLDPKVDIIFKALFTGSPNSKELLTAFLNAVLQNRSATTPPVNNVKVLSAALLPLYEDNKLSIVDIKIEATDPKGKKFNVEMQLQDHDFFAERILYYWAKIFSEDLEKSKSYTELRPTISIAICNFDLFPESRECHHIFHLKETVNPNRGVNPNIGVNSKPGQSHRNSEGQESHQSHEGHESRGLQDSRQGSLPSRKSGGTVRVPELKSRRAIVFSNHIEIHTIELKKVKFGKISDILTPWALFLQNPNGPWQEELIMTNPYLQKAYEQLGNFGMDPNMKADYDLREKTLHDVASLWDQKIRREAALVEALQKGQEKGRQEGLATGELVGLKKSLKRILLSRFPAEQVASVAAKQIEESESISELELWIEKAFQINELRELFQC